jgi:hypothetical protein
MYCTRQQAIGNIPGVGLWILFQQLITQLYQARCRQVDGIPRCLLIVNTHLDVPH